MTAAELRHISIIVPTHDEWRYFIDAIQQDASVECTLEDGRRALQVVLVAVESASLGKAVKVAQAPRRIMPLAAELSVQSGGGERTT
jgi:predicted dehydrogenase